jgi:hypothetical protein
MSRILRNLVVLPAFLGLLSACSSDEKENNCPPASAIVETSIATVFVPGASPDPSNILYTVEIEGVKASCDTDKLANEASSSLTISFKATRAPSGTAVHYEVPYFVAVSQTERIVAKKLFTIGFDFEPGQTVTTFEDTVGTAKITAAKEKKTFDYVILAGLQLTKAQIEYNRSSGRLTP